MLLRQTDYDRLYRDFAWTIPPRYNIGVDACDRHADGTGRLALIYVADTGAWRDRVLVRLFPPTVQPLRQRPASRTASPGATGWRSCCRKRRKPPSPIWPHSSAA